MKRHPALIDLSRDHHHALVLAKSLMRDAPQRLTASWPDDLSARIAAVQQRFEEELEPHFRAEEAVLFPRAKAGDPSLLRITEQVEDQHQELRDTVRNMSPDHLDEQLDRFARLLEEHVRLEERSWFPAIEGELDDVELAEVDRLLKAQSSSSSSKPRPAT